MASDVVLSGKVTQGGSPLGDSKGDKKFRMAKLLLEKDKSRAITMLKEVVDNYSDCSAADDALYYLITNVQNRETADEYLLQLKAYHPGSPFISKAENYINGKEEARRRKEEEEAARKKHLQAYRQPLSPPLPAVS